MSQVDAGQPPSSGPTDPNTAVNHEQSKLVMDIVVKTLDAYGKSKKPSSKAPAGAPGADPNAMPPGPVTGMPGDMSAIAKNGPLTLGG